MAEYTNNLTNESYIKGLFNIFECIVDSNSVNETNSAEIIKHLLESVYQILTTIISKIQIIIPKNNLELFLF